jgi:integrase
VFRFKKENTMNAKKSTQTRCTDKPKLPKKNFPLTVHPSGQFSKKRRGKIYYFGSHADPQAALEKFNHSWSFILAGQPVPPMGQEFLTVGEVCNRFLEDCESKVDAGERSRATLEGYIRTAQTVAKFLGKQTPVESLTPDRFAELRKHLADGVGMKTLEGRIAETRAIFNHADKNGLLERSPRRLWGTQFDKPGKLALKKAKKADPKSNGKSLTAKQIRGLLDIANQQLKAMILMGVNCGFGNTDCGQLCIEDLTDDGFVQLTRSKTGIDRRCPLWKETQAALADVIGDRESGLVFRTRWGASWEPKTVESKNGKLYHDDAISKEFGKLKRKANIVGRGIGFYSLRHMFQTVGDASRDFVAVSFLMGHSDGSMASHYREFIPDDRLTTVTDTVRQWLFGDAVEGGAK